MVAVRYLAGEANDGLWAAAVWPSILKGPLQR